MQWIADRFFTVDDTWIDAASGGAVRMHFSAARPDDDLAWSERCGRLSNLRHPLLNPLIDYGIGPDGCRFEAYECGAPVPAARAAAEGALYHVARFLRGHDLTVDGEVAPFLMRPVVAGRAIWQRPIGLTIQGRRALEAVEESLDGFSPAGPSIVTVKGASQAGLRTLRMLAARSARTRGFLPLDPCVVARNRELIELVRERHVCVLDAVDDPGRSAESVARLISALAAGSARRHVVLRFCREPAGRSNGIELDPLSVRSLIGMVFTGGEGDPGEEELFRAARAAGGLPGVFVCALGAGAQPFMAASSYGSAPPAVLVHETSPAFTAEGAPPAQSTRQGAGRLLGSALSAGDRAAALARRGRHSVAARVLARGMRVLEGRERGLEAASCAIQLAWLALDRGTTAEALRHFDRAHQLAAGAPLGILATIGTGVSLTDDCRLIEAEAVLRGSAAAADTIRDPDACAGAAAALARCLYWQERYTEAVAIAQAQRDTACDNGSHARLLAILARAQARLGRAVLAVRTAREAQHAAAAADLRVQASAELAVAEALEATGDADGAQAALARVARLGRAGHLPLFHLRALLLSLASAGAPRASRTLSRLQRLKVPALFTQRLHRITIAPPARRLEPVAELEQLLDGSQRAVDDAAATMHICRTVGERLGAGTVALFGTDDRTLTVHGRGWPAMPLAARESLARGEPLRPDGRREPQESAEPVRYGGEVIATLACRWVAGATIDVEGAAVLLRAAALSAGPYVRAMLDRVIPDPSPVWGDLIGQSAPAATLRESVVRAARAPFPVLVEGESGCGKELVARAIHRLSPRRDRRFCALNCAALTDDLVEAELFGHARGAFTGAATERAGLFEEADGGTLFLDEVGELSARAQAKLLRVLQEGEVRRVGENFPRRVDVRVVAATNRRLEEEAAAGRFRTDLRFRLDVVRITVPPLRDRTSDIPLLAAHFWQDASSRVGSHATLSREALAALARYDWPGNVREIQNVIAWIAVHSPRRGRIGPSALPGHVAQATVITPSTFEAAREEFERRFIRAALAGANGRLARAAEALGVTRQGLSKMMRRLRIEGP